MKFNTGAQIWADSMKKNGEDEIVVQNFYRESVEKMPLGRTSTWNCKEEIIQIQETRSNYMKETGSLCMKSHYHIQQHCQNILMFC